MVRQRTTWRERLKVSGQCPRSIDGLQRFAWSCTVVLSCAIRTCDALEHVYLEIGQISAPSVHASAVTVDLNLASAPGPTVQTRISQLQSTAPALSYREIEINCAAPVVKQPRFACDQAAVQARGGPTGEVAMQASAAYDSSNGAVSLSGSGLRIAGAQARFTGKLAMGTWNLNLDADGLNLVAARRLVEPWVQLPAAVSFNGHVSMRLEASGPLAAASRSNPVRATLSARSTDLNLSNRPGTLVGQKLSAVFDGSATRAGGRIDSDVRLQGAAGQALAGAVLLDFGLNPLDLRAHLSNTGHTIDMSRVRLAQRDLIDAQGTGRVLLRNPLLLTQAHVDIQRLEIAAAYRSFLQIALATTDFGALNVGGRASGDFDIAKGAIRKINARLTNFSAADSTTRLSLANANGELHWVSDPNGPVEPCQLSWSASSSYGLIGGPVRADFTLRGRDFVLAADTRLPIFDGALIVHKLTARRLSAPDAELEFDAHLEPISMPLLSKAFGWPELSGQLAGRIPAVTYRDHILRVDGDLSANVFDGTIVGSRLELRDPLGPWPRLDADVQARRLDLDLLTHTFATGSITGRLDADIKGLELFNWSPVAFDAKLQSTPDDRSPRLISQRAVADISSIGGGGGGVTAALQSGVLKFFDRFHYDRIGISCQLRDDVCLMNGIEPAKTGYYMVKGRGIPRIDIIGNAGRVDWSQLVAQIAAGMRSQNVIVR